MPEAVSDGMQVAKSVVRLVRGDITELDVDAFIFYAQPDLAVGSGFGTAISVRGGPSIQKELQELAPVATGDAVLTAAGKLPATYIIHAVGPRFQEEDMEGKLRTTMRACLRLADEKGVKRLAFPAMGVGYYGVPIAMCVRVTLEVIRKHLDAQSGIDEVVVCVFDAPQYDTFRAAIAAMG